MIRELGNFKQIFFTFFRIWHYILTASGREYEIDNWYTYHLDMMNTKCYLFSIFLKEFYNTLREDEESEIDRLII